jgi:carbonic anhydrase
LPVQAPTPTLRGPEPVEGGSALERLLAGNARYVANRLQYPGHSSERRAQVAEGQHPFAAILCCSDSRVPPEILFDQGLGDLFVTRVAGNVADDELIGSLEYAVEHLGVRLIMVLGHERCGAVRAALETVLAGAEAEGHLEHLVQAIEPALEEAQLAYGDAWEAVAAANVERQAALLRHSRPLLAEFVEAGEVEVVAARYDLDSGWVTLLEADAAEAHS